MGSGDGSLVVNTFLQQACLSHCRQKGQMQKQNGGKEVDERQLFHGTNTSFVDAICQQNFDWRVCGLHGTSYGKGKAGRPPPGAGKLLKVSLAEATGGAGQSACQWQVHTAFWPLWGQLNPEPAVLWLLLHYV